MEMNLFYKLAFLSLFSTAILPFIIGVVGLSFKKHLFGATLAACLSAFVILLICGVVCEYNSKITLNDVTINAHFVDGYNKHITKKAITNEDLPYIGSCHGGFFLKFGGQTYYGVIRYEYMSKKSYQINYIDYINRK